MTYLYAFLLKEYTVNLQIERNNAQLLNYC